MNLKEAAERCENAWRQYAEKNQLKRDDAHYFMKLQEEAGELVRTYLEMRGSEKKRDQTPEEFNKRFAGDMASMIGNALILALHYNIDIEKAIKEKFPEKF